MNGISTKAEEEAIIGTLGLDGIRALQLRYRKNGKLTTQEHTLRGVEGKDLIAEKERLVYGRVACYVCGEHMRRDQRSKEHIWPRHRGGGDHIGNLALSHRLCNSKRGPLATERHKPLPLIKWWTHRLRSKIVALLEA